MLAETESVYMLVVREQALIAQLFDVGIADNNEDADVAFFQVRCLSQRRRDYRCGRSAPGYCFFEPESH